MMYSASTASASMPCEHPQHNPSHSHHHSIHGSGGSSNNHSQANQSYNAYPPTAQAGNGANNGGYSAPGAGIYYTASTVGGNQGNGPSAGQSMYTTGGAMFPVTSASYSGPVPNMHAGVKLFIGQVPAVCTEEQLRPIFSEFGALLEVKIMREPNGRSKGSAWVRYETEEAAVHAIEALNEKRVVPPQTNPLRVVFATPNSSRGQRVAPTTAISSTSVMHPPIQASAHGYQTAYTTPGYTTTAPQTTATYGNTPTAYVSGQYAPSGAVSYGTVEGSDSFMIQQHPNSSSAPQNKVTYIRSDQSILAGGQPGSVIYSTGPVSAGQTQASQPQRQQAIRPSATPYATSYTAAATGGQIRANVVYAPETLTMMNQVVSPQQQHQQHQQQHQWKGQQN